MSSLPTEIITDILSREPIKDLLRFRCVSKPWCSLIDGPHFIKLHLERSIQTYSLTTLILKHEKLYTLNLDSQKVVKLDHPLKSPNTELLGSCNGLLCLSNKENDVALWNPSTRKHRTLPVSPIRLEGYNFITYGFGYDHVNDDYKVLRIAQRGTPANGGGTFKSEAGIYSLKLNVWKLVEEFPYELCFKDLGVFVSGALHFVVSSKSNLKISYVVAFDLGVEKYRLVPLPEPVEKRMHAVHVGNLAGRLYLLCNWPKSDIDIWVMNDYGVEASWTRLICIPPQVIRSNFAYVKPLAYSENRDLVLLWQKLQLPDYVKLHWYDLGKKTLKDANFRRVPISFDAMSFVASLVPFKGDTVIGTKKLQKPNPREEKRRMAKRGMISWQRYSNWPYKQIAEDTGFYAGET